VRNTPTTLHGSRTISHSANIVVLALGVVQVIPVDGQIRLSTERLHDRGNDALVARGGAITRRLPPPRATEALFLEEIRLPERNLGRVKGDEFLLGGIPAPAGERLRVRVHLGAVPGEVLVIIGAKREGAAAGAVELLAQAAAGLAEVDDIGEGLAVEGHAELDLGRRGNVGLVVVDSLLGIEGCVSLLLRVPAVGGLGVRLAGVHVAEVASEVGEGGALVVKGHQVPVVDVGVHFPDAQDVVALRPGWCRYGEVEVVPLGVDLGVVIKGLERLAWCQKRCKVITNLATALDSVEVVESISGILGVLPVNIKAVQTKVGNVSSRTVAECLSSSFGCKRWLEVGSEAPATDGQSNSQVAVFLLELEQLVEVTEQLSAVCGDITRVRELNIGPFVGKDNLTGGVVHVGERILDLGELVGREVGNHMLASIDSPVDVENASLVLRSPVCARRNINFTRFYSGRRLSNRRERKKSGSVREAHVVKIGRSRNQRLKQSN
jgi:hypothetical protein